MTEHRIIEASMMRLVCTCGGWEFETARETFPEHVAGCDRGVSEPNG